MTSRQRGSSSRRNALFGIVIAIPECLSSVRHKVYIPSTYKCRSITVKPHTTRASRTQARASSICTEQNHRRTCKYIYAYAHIDTHTYTYINMYHKHNHDIVIPVPQRRCRRQQRVRDLNKRTPYTWIFTRI